MDDEMEMEVWVDDGDFTDVGDVVAFDAVSLHYLKLFYFFQVGNL